MSTPVTPDGPHPDASTTKGPEWLADLFFNPPPWVNPLLQVLALATAVIVAYRLYQWDGDIPLDVQREMQIIAGHITAIATATLAMVNWTHNAYVVDVAAGFAVGYGFVLALQTDAVANVLPDEMPGRERASAAWLAIGVSAPLLPMLVTTRGIGVKITKARWLLAGLAVAMLLLNGTINNDTTT